MAEIDVSQEEKDMISPTLGENIPSTNGHYTDQLNWRLDSTTLLPVGTTHTITLS